MTLRDRALVLLLLAAAAGRGANAQEGVRRKGLSVTVTSPVNGDFVIGRTKISAEVKTDKPEMIEKVEFYVGDQLIFIDEEPPYEVLYDFGEQAKELVIKAVAWHREGISVSDFVVTRKLDMNFAVRVNRVLLNASVFDGDGNFVKGLDKKDFVVYEGDARQEVLDFSPETRPILMGILLDVSGSMQERMEEAQKAAAGFVGTLRDIDSAMLVEFNEKVYCLSELTNDREHLKRLIGTTAALGGTALYDALHSTLRQLSKLDGRKAVVILSDGDDTQSQTGWDQVIKEAKTYDVTLYTIALGGSFADAGARGKLKDLADQTGGRYFSAGKASELADVYDKIADELRNQYAIAYASSNEKFDGRWIPIKMESSKKGLTVRSRKGYFAVPRTGS